MDPKRFVDLVVNEARKKADCADGLILITEEELRTAAMEALLTAGLYQLAEEAGAN